MANIASQKKRILRTERERRENRHLTSSLRRKLRRLESAIEGGDPEVIESEHRRLVSQIDKAVHKGGLHRNAGARKKRQAARLRSDAGV